LQFAQSSATGTLFGTSAGFPPLWRQHSSSSIAGYIVFGAFVMPLGMAMATVAHLGGEISEKAAIDASTTPPGECS
jgi:hypothetical protein